MTTAGHFHRAWRELPIGRLDDIIGSGTCLILAPHPDDESLGCGGLVATCVAAGRPPLVAVLTDGAGSHPNSPSFPPDRLRALRVREVQSALECLGLPTERLVLLGEPDTHAPHEGPAFDAVVSRLSGLIAQQTDCTTILAPWRHDPHCDHAAASLIAAAVAAASCIRHVAYPVWGWTLPPASPVADPSPAGWRQDPGTGWRLDIAAFLPAKRAAIQAHRSQYGNLIADDPSGFRLPPALLAVFEAPFETFIQP